MRPSLNIGKARTHFTLNQEKWGRADRNTICLPAKASGAERLAATAATSREHAATVFGRHACAKAVHFATLDLLGLESTEHNQTTPYDLSNCMA